MIKHPGILMLLLLTALAFSACTSVSVADPDGFAIIRRGTAFKAVSPEGVLFKIRYVENYPRMELDFWGKALKKQLQQEGYAFIREEEFTAPKKTGLLFEWGAPFGNEDYVYLTAIIIEGKKIIIAEAAAEHKLYSRYRAALITSLTTLHLK